MGYRDNILSHISESLNLLERLIEDNFTEAGYLIEKITVPTFQQDVLEYIAEKINRILKNLIEKKKFEEAIKLIDKIKNYYYKSKILKDISDELLIYDIDQAIQAIKRIEMPHYRFEALMKVIVSAKSEDLERISEIIGEFKASDLRKIAIELIKKNEISKANWIANLIHDDHYRSEIYTHIAKNLIDKGVLQKAIQAADKIENDLLYSEVLYNIITELVKRNKFDDAKKLAKKIKVRQYYIKSLHCLDHELKKKSLELIREGKLDDAIEIALKIHDKHLKAEILAILTKKLCDPFCDNCNLPYDIVSSSDKKLLIYYCKSCDSAKGVDRVLNLCIPIINVAKRLKHNRQNIEFYGLHDLIYIDKYIPKKLLINQNDFSKSILEFKKGDPIKINEFSIILTTFTLLLIKMKKISPPDVIIPIPGSSAGKISYGHRYLCEYMSKRLKIENGTGYLERIKSVPSHKEGIKPPTEKHYQTIHCFGQVKGKNILLFDDVFTTGNTARACIKRLVESGARHITLIVLGRTI